MIINNCETCDHRENRDEGHCYMFRVEPDKACVHHTFRVEQWRAMRLDYANRLLEKINEAKS